MKQIFNRRLNTSGCCFFCLILTKFKTEGDEDDSKSDENKEEPGTESKSNNFSSLKFIRRYLNINLKLLVGNYQTISNKVLTSKALLKNNVEEEELIEVSLCESCGLTVKRLSSLLQTLETIQMEVNFCLEKINKEITEAAKSPELVQNYSKRMTSDPETLTQLVFVDNLRKEIAKKSLQTSKGTPPEVKLQLHRLDLKTIQKWSAPPKLVLNATEKEELQPQRVNKAKCAYEGDKGTIIDSSAITFEDDDRGSSDSEEFFPSLPTSSSQVKKESATISVSKMYIKNPKTGTVDCSVCKKRFKSAANLRQHYEMVHLRVRKFKCDICGGSYSSEQMLRIHKRKCDGTRKPSRASRGSRSIYNAETGKYNCIKCKKEFNCSVSVSKHYVRVHSNERLNCNICKISVFKNQVLLQRHERSCKDRWSIIVARRTDPRYRFSCPICDKKFTQKAALKRHHSTIHLKERNYFCDICEKTFGQKGDLKIHKNVVHFGKTRGGKNCKKACNGSSTVRHPEQKCGTKNEMKTETKLVSS